MTIPTEENQVVDQKPSDKELNFRRLEEKYQRELEKERHARLEAERLVQEKSKVNDDDDDEPYVDKKKLNKKLAEFGQQSKQETQTEIQKAVQTALLEERKQNWLSSNNDFYEVLNHANKLAEEHPELADTILKLPDSFERQQLVYKNIKALGLNKAKPTEKSMQEKIDSNRKNLYYNPSGTGTAPYQSTSDFSANGQRQAYDKMKELQKNLRI